MRRVAEIIYIVKEQREDFLNSSANPDLETQKVLWVCGVRRQQYFALNDLIFMTFEYEGKDFAGDMDKLAAYLKSKGNLVEKRRKDVAPDRLTLENWWAPVKKIGELLCVDSPLEEEKQYDYRAMFDGCMVEGTHRSDISFDEDDWSEAIHF